MTEGMLQTHKKSPSETDGIQFGELEKIRLGWGCSLLDVGVV